MLQKGIDTLQDFASATDCEWLETNGLGGWSSSSIIGCNTRRYHALLMAATKPPTERMSLVSKMDETIVTNTEKFQLGTNNYGKCIHPEGYKYMTCFRKEIFPQFTYEVGGITLRKTIGMLHGENTVVVIYDIIKAGNPFTMELLPLFSVRDYHNLMHSNDAIHRDVNFENHILKTRAYDETPDMYILVAGSDFHANPNWFYNFNYSVEQNRGLDFVEDLFCYGKFTVALKEGDSVGIILSTENPAGRDAHQLLEIEKNRRLQLLDNKVFDNSSIEQILLLAADQFIVQREEDLKTIIAGYHWFTDWSRDTMISLPGLTLSTGRYNDAKKILAAFANSISMGMLPNRFRDGGEAPEYNNVDGTLWYFIAAYKYLQATGDKDFIVNTILPVLKEIIDWHYKGTRYHIHVTGDQLLYAGETGQQLTWMDAKVDNWVVTPRMGKPVEVQALWYNALKIFSGLLQLNKQTADAATIELNAAKAKQSFSDLFWYSEGNYLYDNIDETNKPDLSIRPNQLFAISLPFALIEGEKALSVLKIVGEQLYTPVGLRSLAKTNTNYAPLYEGDVYHRDGAYHQGTVWSWLLGPYVDAIMKVKPENGKAEAKKIIENFAYHLNEACIGSVSEIFDADAPHYPRGCIAQAWGVAEVLRVVKEYQHDYVAS